MSIWEKKKNEPGRASLTQVRLNAFVEADASHCIAVTTWANKFRHDRQTYSREVLKARKRELAPKVEELEKVVRFPDPAMDPDLWLKDRERLARLTGQLHAIQSVLDGRISAPGPPPSTAAPVPAWDSSTPDPFETE